jgi:hypothetical protein
MLKEKLKATESTNKDLRNEIERLKQNMDRKQKNINAYKNLKTVYK